MALDEDDGFVTASADMPQPTVMSVALAAKDSEFDVIHPEHRNVYDIWVVFTNVPLAIGFSEILALV